MMTRSCLLWVAICGFAPRASATEAGLDVGHVVDNGVVDGHLDAVDSTGTRWVRVNMRLDAWSAPDDAWFAAYDSVIDAYLARGIEVYALINDEAVNSPYAVASPQWIADYVQNAVQIVDHFKNRVRTFELVNEPNNWVDGTMSPRFSSAQLAQVLHDTYVAVKHGDRCSDVQLVSGPLFSFDGTDASQYLADTYAAMTPVDGAYPIDGVGYHIYVAQGSDSSVADVGTGVATNLGALWNVIASYEGAGTSKRVWVSEYGWRADAVGDAGQAARMQAGFDAMAQQGHVAMGAYFQLQDFPGNEWGVFADAANPATRRPSADMLASLADAHAPARAARIEAMSVPVLAPGQTGELILQVVNRGSSTWTDGWRLGAGAGCPDAAQVNELEWAPNAGYANGLTDARVYLPGEVAPGASVELHVPIVAPMQDGQYVFAARMVQEGVTWFGPTVTATVTVSGTGSGSGMGSGTGSGSGTGVGSGTGSGCSTTAGDSLWIFAAVAGVRRRRNRHGVKRG